MESSSAISLFDRVKQQGDQVRQLKADKATKEDVLAAVGLLKQLKLEYKDTTGQGTEFCIVLLGQLFKVNRFSVVFMRNYCRYANKYIKKFNANEFQVLK